MGGNGFRVVAVLEVELLKMETYQVHEVTLDRVLYV
jgi:hypothetical protein